MAKRNAAAENAAVEETAVVEETTAKTLGRYSGCVA